MSSTSSLSCTIRGVSAKDDRVVYALFNSVWRSRSLGTVFASLQSPGGLGLCFLFAIGIHRSTSAALGGNVSRILMLFLHVAVPFLAVLPVAGLFFLRSQHNQRRYIKRSQPSMRSVSSWVSKGPSRKCFVCCSGKSGEIVGCVMVNRNEIVELVVSEQHRRKGIARRLVAAAEDCMAQDVITGDASYDNIHLVVTSAQPAAIELYRCCGFAVTRRSTPTIFSDQDFVMTKVLKTCSSSLDTEHSTSS
jgi:ribosomal protein S18 acetylase RimI-like enzyme